MLSCNRLFSQCNNSCLHVDEYTDGPSASESVPRFTHIECSDLFKPRRRFLGVDADSGQAETILANSQQEGVGR